MDNVCLCVFINVVYDYYEKQKLRRNGLNVTEPQNHSAQLLLFDLDHKSYATYYAQVS